MQNKLTKLIDQAALNVTEVDSEHLSGLKDLQNILVAIQENVSHMNFSEDILEQTERMKNSIEQLIKDLFEDKIEDTATAIKEISETISDIQRLFDTAARGVDKASSEIIVPNENTSDENSETHDEGMVISEDFAPMIPDFVSEAEEHLQSAEAGLLEIENNPSDTEGVNLIFRAFHNIKGVTGFLALDEMGSLAHSAENMLDLARKGKLLLEGSNIDLVFESIDVMKSMVSNLTKAVENGGLITPQKNLGPLLKKLDACSNAQSPLSSADNSPGTTSKSKLDKVSDTDISTDDAEIAVNFKSGSSEEKIRVSVSRLDNLVNMVGEMMIAQSMVTQQVFEMLAPEHELCRTVSQQNKMIRELQDLSMSMRMVPIQGVFQKIARIVRDLSHKANKNISFSTIGDETELDRHVVDQLSDPLVHMIRNCVDHGIESKQERASAGKDPIGHIQVRAFRRADNVIIEITDDGKGLDKDSILKKAIDHGVVSDSEELSEKSIYKLIFHPGLSTAQEVTSVSGRGVGMNIVKKNIKALRGKIDINTTLGKGTVFTISMPLTLAMIDSQIVRVGQEQYIIPTGSIEQSFRPKPEQLTSVQGQGEMVSIRGEVLPMIRLNRLFGTKPDSEDPTKSSLVIVESDDQKACLLVDELLGQQQVIIKNLGQWFGGIEGVSGGTIMSDGRVSLILDILGLIKLSRN